MTPRFFRPETHKAAIAWLWQAALGALDGQMEVHRDGLILRYNATGEWVEVSNGSALLLCVSPTGIGIYADTEEGVWYATLGAWLKASPQSTHIPVKHSPAPSAEETERRAVQAAAYLSFQRSLQNGKPARWNNGRFRSMGRRGNP